jgi:hypothetical protein
MSMLDPNHLHINSLSKPNHTFYVRDKNDCL